jgi:hypothetical protein
MYAFRGRQAGTPARPPPRSWRPVAAVTYQGIPAGHWLTAASVVRRRAESARSLWWVAGAARTWPAAVLGPSPFLAPAIGRLLLSFN